MALASIVIVVFVMNALKRDLSNRASAGNCPAVVVAILIIPILSASISFPQLPSRRRFLRAPWKLVTRITKFSIGLHLFFFLYCLQVKFPETRRRITLDSLNWTHGVSLSPFS
jgi:hypothetical protein